MTERVITGACSAPPTTAHAAAPMIQLDHVSKQFNGKTVLHDINLHIAAGSFTTVIGQSGSGKTTLLRLLNGLIQPDSGRVIVRGQDLAQTDLVQLRRSIGYVIQESGLFPHMNIRANIAYVLTLLQWPPDRIQQRVEELLGIVHLAPDLLGRYPHQLSGGQRQRVGIARALAARPDLILMDEPFGAVDEITRRALQEEIKHIQQHTGSTIVFITHDIDEALALGSQLVILHQGHIVANDSPAQLLQTPPNATAAELLHHRKGA
ncbi:MAG: ATP-binding cassette domain-containing protein [Brachymonas sp.]|nr:ATP-binding cassette domain-containing protein [Brachymonas sp.]